MDGFNTMENSICEVFGVVLAAAKSNKPVVVSNWMENLSTNNASAMAQFVQILQHSTHYLSVDVIKLFEPPTLSREFLYRIINVTNSCGMTIIHQIAQAQNPQENYNYGVLEILTHLCEQGGDPTILCKQGTSAKDIAEDKNNRLTVVLLEILEQMHCQVLKRSPSPDYADINKLHKTLLHWAVHTNRHQIVSNTLTMHQMDSYENICHMLFEPDCSSSEKFQGAPMFVASRILNTNLLKTLIVCSGISLKDLEGKKRRQVFHRLDGTSWELWYSPLSLILSEPHNDPLLEVLVDLNESLDGFHITKVNLSRTNMISLPVKIFKFHSLCWLDVSDNSMSELPLSAVPNTCWPILLKNLNISHNLLERIPSELFKLPCLNTLNLSHNPLKSLPCKWQDTTSIVSLNVSHTHLESLSVDIDDQLTSQFIASSVTLPRLVPVHGKASLQSVDCIASKIKHKTDSLLQSLVASHCRIKTFPGLLALFFPNLDTLDLSSNKLQSFCAINELPASLTKLDISNNHLENCNENKIFYRDTRLSMKSSCLQHKSLSRLSTLKLANNTNLKSLKICDETLLDDNCVFFPKLLRLDLSNCGLLQAPNRLVELQDLTDLVLSGNKDLTIPHEICNLESLVYFKYDGVEDPIVNELNLFTRTKEKLLFLRETNAIRCPSIKLIFIDEEEINLVSSLSNTGFKRKGQCFVTPDEYTWCISHSKKRDFVINFNVWDFTGQKMLSFVSQCFFADNVLFVLCWQITDDQDHGVEKLRSWLMRIQYQTTTSVSVVIVGYMLSVIDKRLRDRLVRKVQMLCENEPQFYPTIISIEFISASQLELGILNLRASLYDTASELRVSQQGVVRKLKDMKVPIKYFKLQGILSKKVNCIKKNQDEGPPILTFKEMLMMVSQDKVKDACCLFTDEWDFAVAVKYLSQNGTIMHFDNLGVSDYYFIDPHWLYHVFCRVCASTTLTSSSKVEYNDGKVSRLLIEQVLGECGIPPKYISAMFKLLCRFEIAIPLDSGTLLLPSSLNSNPINKIYSSLNCNFPRNNESAVIMNSSRTSRLFTSFKGLPPVDANAQSVHKTIDLCFTGMCYRRFFLARHIPESFWQKLIPRFITSAKIFDDIFLSNCVEGMTIERAANADDAFICNDTCKWLYWRNGITLTFGDDVLFCVNGLMQTGPLSVTVEKIREMRFFDGNHWKKLLDDGNDGIEVKIPDYLVISSIEKDKVYRSWKLGPQILSHVLEILNELSAEFFSGEFHKGIYSGSYFKHLVVCPYCYGDSKPLAVDLPPVFVETELSKGTDLQSCYMQSLERIDVSDIVRTSNTGLYGFSIQICNLEAQKHGAIRCPRHGILQLQYLTPDLMAEDVLLWKIWATTLEKPVGKGSFGVVYKVKHPSDPKCYAALKCYAEELIIAKSKDHSLEDLATMYGDMRLELNKLSSVNHPNIIGFVGICVVSFSFLLEWAPKGNLSETIQGYRLADCPICPDAVANTIQQISSALAYLHTKKNIVHFDIKPDNLLVFKYPQPGHSCFSSKKSLICESCYNEGGGVLVKLADLGISAFFGPGGFQRRNTTPAYGAPEVLKYSGKEPLTEKVDIFSLGITLYSILTLRKVPLEGAELEFSADIAAGRRPEFLPEDPNYPLPLLECVRSCWAQEYTQRPAAKRLEETFRKSNCLTFKNSYEIKNTRVSAAVVTTADGSVRDEEMVWIAYTSNDGTHNLASYTFSEQSNVFLIKRKEKSTHPKLCKRSQYAKLKHPVKQMHPYGQHIWILYDNGFLAVFDMESHKMIENIELQQLLNIPVTLLVADPVRGTMATAYTNGLIAYLWDKDIPFDSNISIAYFHSSQAACVSHQTFALTAVESCSVNDQCQLWCSYDIGIIQIAIPPVEEGGKTRILKVLQVKEYCLDLPDDAYITQLKFSRNVLSGSKSSFMYALDDGGLVISCWSVGINPTLCSLIKPSLSSPASVLLPVGNTLYVGDKNGKVYLVRTNQVKEGVYSFDLLPGGHCVSSKVDFLVSLQGQLNAHGFLSEVGVTTLNDGDSKQEFQNSVYCVKRPVQVGCSVLMSIGNGYQETITDCAHDGTYFVVWALPLSDN